MEYKKQPKTAFVLEGGAMRGLYSAGVLDVFMQKGIDTDAIYGVSAGALFGINFKSKQIGRAIRYNLKYAHEKNYMGLYSLITTGNIMNKEFCFNKLVNELDIFDFETFNNSPVKFYAVVTNIETGKPEYLKIKSPIDDLEKLRATSAMPLASKIIKIDGKKYLDGGISDSIPIHFNKEKCKKNIIVLTQPLDYKKKTLSKLKERIIKLRFYKYKKLINTMLDRYNEYNKVIEDIIEMEKNGEIFVIRPNKKINIKLSENNPEKLQEIYDLGVNCCKKVIKDLKKYLDN